MTTNFATEAVMHVAEGFSPSSKAVSPKIRLLNSRVTWIGCWLVPYLMIENLPSTTKAIPSR
jgi:hypothetical protein